MGKEKNGKSLEAVTHTHTHTHREFRENNKIIEAQYNCVYSRYKDGLCFIVCLFCAFLVPDTG